MKTKLILAASAACGVAVLIAQQRPTGPYTQNQVAAGRTTYETNCVSCHAADLSGREGPQLAGANFMAQWGDRTAGDLIKYIQSTMPPGAAALPGDSYQNLAAFLLDANGARAGDQILTRASTVAIRAISSGQRAAYLQTAAHKPSKTIPNKPMPSSKERKPRRRRAA
jgi:mono/diheme cytochrome c family protein